MKKLRMLKSTSITFAEGNFIMRQTELLVPAKHFELLKPNIQAHISDCADGFTTVHLWYDFTTFAYDF